MILLKTLLNSFMEGHYHIETSPLICSANQWTGFYMITASVMKELNKYRGSKSLCHRLHNYFLDVIFHKLRTLAHVLYNWLYLVMQHSLHLGNIHQGTTMKQPPGLFFKKGVLKSFVKSHESTCVEVSL